jgi:hypothetical protein
MPKKPAVSMRKETYEKLKEEAQKRGIAISTLLQEILDESLSRIERPGSGNGHFELGTPLRPADRERFDDPTTTPMVVPQDSPAMTRMRKS